jgi:hypothetical protein
MSTEGDITNMVVEDVEASLNNLPPLDSLKCKLCNDFFKSPMTLSCMHSYCLDCLLKLHGTDDLSQYLAPKVSLIEGQEPPPRNVLNCPTCTSLGVEQVMEEQTEPFPNARLTRIVKLVMETPVLCENCKNCQSEKLCETCKVHLCASCWLLTHSARIFTSHVSKQLSHVEMTALPKCPTHKVNEQEFFVTEEEMGACQVCLLKGPYQGAQYTQVPDVRKQRQDEIEQALGDVQLTRERLVLGKEMNQTILQELDVSFQNSTLQVVENFKSIREALDKREEQTLQALKALKDAKINVIQEQIVECSQLINQIDDGVENVNLVLKHSNSLEVIYQTVVIGEHLQMIGSVGSTAPLSCTTCQTEQLPCHHPSVDASLPVLLSEKVPQLVMAYAAVPSPEQVFGVMGQEDLSTSRHEPTLEQQQVLKEVQVVGREQEYGCVVC